MLTDQHFLSPFSVAVGSDVLELPGAHFELNWDFLSVLNNLQRCFDFWSLHVLCLSDYWHSCVLQQKALAQFGLAISSYSPLVDLKQPASVGKLVDSYARFDVIFSPVLESVKHPGALFHYSRFVHGDLSLFLKGLSVSLGSGEPLCADLVRYHGSADDRNNLIASILKR